MRSRPRLLWLLVAAVVVLPACQRLASSAALVNDHAISVGALREEVRRGATGAQFQEETEAQLKERTRQILTFLIDLEVIRQYADARGITVTQADVEDQFQALVAQIGDRAAFDRFLAERGLTLEDARTIAERQALISLVRDDLAASDQDLDAWLGARVRSIEILVNPRFGRFDPTTGMVVAITSTADLG